MGGKRNSEVWKMVRRGWERRGNGRGDVSRFKGGSWVGHTEYVEEFSALQLWEMHRET